MPTVHEELGRIGDAVRERFVAQKRVLSFEEFIALFRAHPDRHARDAARYIRDCFDHYGSYQVERPWGDVTRFRLFDQPFEEVAPPGASALRRDYLIGQEDLQNAFYRILSNFVREGRANRLTLMHGPNGSAKSTFASCVMRAMEHYSTLDEGALYRFSWVFPHGKDGKTIGFGSLDDARPAETYAHAADGEIDAKLISELREHPLLLLPTQERRRFVEAAYADKGIEGQPPDWIWSGQLGPKNQQIYEALLTAYRGEMMRVLAHVQIERFYISRRYRVGAVTIGPEMAVDAHEKQITADRSLGSLPASLSSLALYEPYGELVDASAGLVEYSDLLKRPLDAWKYLLLSIETGEVSLELSNMPLNFVMIASSNENLLAAFKEHPEYNSFRGRLSLVRAPYLLDYHEEQTIYDAQIVPQVRRHVAPHATFVAALWAVLTRLRKPQGETYKNAKLGNIAASLTPLEKARLYADGAIPPRLSLEDAQELRSGIEAIWREPASWPVYEGISGASPREIRTLLLDAAQQPGYTTLSPIAVLERIEQLCDQADYAFLKDPPEGGYHDPKAFIHNVRQAWLDRVEDELRIATGLVDEQQYTDLFDRYVTHVSFWLKNERVYNRLTERYEDPDLDLLNTIEKTLGAGRDKSDFRKDLISAVAAYAIDHPGEMPDYSRLFPHYFERMRQASFEDRKGKIVGIARDLIVYLREEGAGLDAERTEQARTTVDALRERFGYNKDSALDAVTELLRSAAYSS